MMAHTRLSLSAPMDLVRSRKERVKQLLWIFQKLNILLKESLWEPQMKTKRWGIRACFEKAKIINFSKISWETRSDCSSSCGWSHRSHFSSRLAKRAKQWQILECLLRKLDHTGSQGVWFIMGCQTQWINSCCLPTVRFSYKTGIVLLSTFSRACSPNCPG